MKTIEYSTVDKSSWPRGPWDLEPDKIQYQDEATGLPCLIVRNGSGALCGYVGVPVGHPWHGIGYSECLEGHPEDEHGIRCWEHSPESLIEVHGGLTFARGCADNTPEAMAKHAARIPDAEAEASRFPVGDSAQWLKEWKDLLGNFLAWKARREATTICHVAEDQDQVWWFGFDCAHCDDLSPGYSGRLGIYRDVPYVKEQIASLAKQLAEAVRC